MLPEAIANQEKERPRRLAQPLRHCLRTRLPGEGVQILTRRPFSEGFTHLGEHPSLKDRVTESFLQRFLGFSAAFTDLYEIFSVLESMSGYLSGKSQSHLGPDQPLIEFGISLSHFHRAEVFLGVLHAGLPADAGNLLQGQHRLVGIFHQ